jgi:3'-phosphoadenosine 5'-phosphosulfate sulfotransferase (PAPS reductase)/FAD synthetase
MQLSPVVTSVTPPAALNVAPEIKPKQSEESVDNLIMAMMGISKKIDTFRQAIISLLDNGDHIAIAHSGTGKDSSTVATIALDTIADYKKRGGVVPAFAILHGDTKVENPLVHKLTMGKNGELAKIGRFLEENDLAGEGSIHVAEPYITSDYIVSLIGGRTIASMPDNDSKCSVDLKVQPMTRLKKKVFKDLKKSDGSKGRVVTLIGTRHEESAARSKAMKSRSESATRPVQGKDGHWVLSPIADFTIEDIFLIFDYAKNGKLNAYSDLKSVMELYGAASEPGTCSLSAFTDDNDAGGCTSGSLGRMGCFLCLKIKRDFSLQQLTKDDEFAFMKPLNDFRNYIQDTHYDPRKRNWLSRSIDDQGRITLSPNAYSPEHCRELLRMAITIDIREERAAAALGIEPRFELISRERLIAIEIYWDRYGYHSRFEACRIYNDVRKNGNVMDIPVVENPHSKLPKVKAIKLPFADKDYYSTYNGFRDAISAATGAETQISKGEKLDQATRAKYGSQEDYLKFLHLHRERGASETYANYLRRENGLKEREEGSQDIPYENVPVSDRMTIDEEGLNMFFDFPELGIDYYVKKYGQGYKEIAPSAALFELPRLGFVSIKAGQQSEMDRMLRMSNQIHRLGLRGILSDPEALKAALGGNDVDQSEEAAEGGYDCDAGADEEEHSDETIFYGDNWPEDKLTESGVVKGDAKRTWVSTIGRGLYEQGRLFE